MKLVLATLATLQLLLSSAWCATDLAGMELRIFLFSTRIQLVTQKDLAELVHIDVGLAASNAELAVRNIRPLYCVPSGTKFSEDDILTMLRGEAKEREEAGTETVLKGLISALRRKYPCK